MSKPNLTFLEEVLKRWPIVLLTSAGFWWLMSVLFSIQADMISIRDDIKMIHFATDKDKEVQEFRFVALETKTVNHDNRLVEIEKWQNKAEAILPRKLKNLEDIQ